jgi:hypothetical protein
MFSAVEAAQKFVSSAVIDSCAISAASAVQKMTIEAKFDETKSPAAQAARPAQRAFLLGAAHTGRVRTSAVQADCPRGCNEP